jgi:hypothetical protein
VPYIPSRDSDDSGVPSLEFVCVNSDYHAGTPPHKQEALFEALKTVPGIHIARDDFSDDDHTERSMKVIFRPDAPKHASQTVRALARRHGVAIDKDAGDFTPSWALEDLKDDAVRLSTGEKPHWYPEMTHFHTT